MRLFGNEQVTITRYGAVGADRNRATSTIYSGRSDFQTISGQEFVDAQGAVHTVSARCIISPSYVPGNTLPDVHEDDVAAYNGVRYVVLQATAWPAPAAHLDLQLRRGPVKDEQPKP